jgi:hypothetical protein
MTKNYIIAEYNMILMLFNIICYLDYIICKYLLRHKTATIKYIDMTRIDKNKYS